MSEINSRTDELVQAVLYVGSDLDLEAILDRFVRSATELTGAKFGALNILDAFGNSTTFVQTGVSDSLVAKLAHSPHAVGVLGAIPDEGVLLLNDLRDHPAFQGFPQHHPHMGSFLGTAVRVGGAAYGYLYLSEKPGGFTQGDVSIVLELGAAAALALQNAELYANARLREDWLRAGQDITTMLLSGADEEDVLEQIAATSREVAHADTSALILPGVDGELTVELTDGYASMDLLGLVMPEDGRTASTMRHGTGLLVPSLHAQRRVRVPLLRQFGPALYAPLEAEDQVLGVLLLLRKVGSVPFGDKDLLTARSFANQAALALVLSEARVAKDRSKLLDERERIARDLHDLAIQQLFATGMQLESARRRVGGDEKSAELADIIEQALDSVDSSVRQIRSIVYAIKDPEATEALVERLRRESSLARTGLGYAPSFILRLDKKLLADSESIAQQEEEFNSRLSHDLSMDVVAVVREGLANAARHAQATAVRVTVDVSGHSPTGYVRVEVEDDGSGIPANRTRASGTQNLAARARQHGGTFSIGVPPSGRGTLLSWQSPL